MFDATFIWKSVAAVMLAALLMAAGAAIDHHYFVKPVEAEQNQQIGATTQAKIDITAENKRIEDKQNEQTKQAAIAYADAVDRLNQWLQRRSGADNKRMPSASISSSTIATSSVQPRGTCDSSGDDPCLIERIFYNRALADAAAVDGWGDWADRQGFPIDN